MPLWFTQTGIIAIALSLLISMFGVPEVVKAVIGVGAVILIYYSFLTLYRAYGPHNDEELEEFLDEVGLGDEIPEFSPWDAQLNLLLIAGSAILLVIIIGPLLLLQIMLSALALFIMWTASSDLSAYLRSIFIVDDYDQEEQDEPSGPDIAGFSQFNPAKH